MTEISDIHTSSNLNRSSGAQDMLTQYLAECEEELIAADPYTGESS